MKKQIKFILLSLFLMILIPLNVKATTVNLKLDCTNPAKIGSTITCRLLADVSGGNATINSYQVSAITNFSPDSLSKSPNKTLSEGSNQVVDTFSLVPKSNTSSAKISVMNVNSDVSISQSEIYTNVKILDNDSSANFIIDGTETSIKKGGTYTKGINKKEIEIKVDPNSDSASYTGSGKKTLACGENNFKVVVTAEDKSQSTYNISINRSCNSTTTLKGISLSSGSLSPTFTSTTTSYKVKVSKDIEKITIKAIKDNDKQTVEGEVSDKSLSYGENKYSLKVTSEDGKTSTYTVIVEREEGRNKSAYLKSLTLSNAKLKFKKTTYEYTTKVLYDVTSLRIDAVAESSSAKIEVKGGTNLIVGENQINIKVTAETGDVKEYNIKVIRLKEGETLGDNPNVKSLLISGYNIEFDPSKTSYTLKIDKEKSLKFTIEMEEKGATYTISGNKNLRNKSIIKITGESEDGTTKVYNIKIEKDTYLLLIIVAAVSIVAAIVLIILIVKKDKGTKAKGKKVKINKIKEEDLLTRSALDNEKTKVVDEEIVEELNSHEIELEKAKYDPEPIVKEAEVTLPKEEETKVCSLCGHRLPAGTKVCPYCKKSFE